MSYSNYNVKRDVIRYIVTILTFCTLHTFFNDL